MPRPFLLLYLVTTLAACGKSDPPPATRTRPAGDEGGPLHVVDHSKEALTRVQDSVQGVSFSLELPAGLKREAKDAYVHWTMGGNSFLEPSITVMKVDGLSFPTSVDDAAERALRIKGEERTVPSKRATAQGFLVTTQRPDGQFLAVTCHVKKGDAILEGSWMQRTGTGRSTDQPIPSLDATRAWAEQICGSLTID